MDQLRAHRATPWRQLGRASAVVRRAVPGDGLRAADLARKLARHRSQPVGQCRQAVCDGVSLGGQALHDGRCQRVSRLAHLVGPGCVADPACAQAVRERCARRRSGQHGVCARFQHHRSVPELVRVGAVSIHQGGHQAAHVAGPARGHPGVHPHQRRQAARRERAGLAGLRGRCVLRDGSRLCGLRQAARIASGRRLLRHARQVDDGCPACVLGSHRSQHGCHQRPAGHAQWALLGQEVSRASAPHPLQGPRVGQDAGLPDQQHGIAGADDCRAVQEPLAGRAVLRLPFILHSFVCH